MNGIYSHYIIDIASNNNFVQFSTMQGDGNNVRGFEVELIENGKQYVINPDTTIVSIAGTKADTKQILNECVITEDGYILIDVTSQMSAVKGRGDYSIVLMDKEKNSQLKSFPFYILTTSAPFDINHIISSDEFQLLTKRVTEVEVVVDNANEKIEEMTALENTLTENENIRKENETNRINTENNRVNAEYARVDAENIRVSNENIRKSEETKRVEAENTRKTEETKRINAESTRVTTESKRVTDEAGRVNAENTRVNNENTRKQNENTRITNETARETEFNEFMNEANAEVERLKQNNDTATASAALAEQYKNEAKTSADTAIEKANIASDSATNAKSSEDKAKISETNASNSAATASTKATEALNSATNAKTSETNASKSATSASSSATSALNSAKTATTKATEASNSASSAQTSASTATTKASEASTYAIKAESFSQGGTGSRENEDVQNAQYYYEQVKQISEGLNGALLPMGTITFSQLSSQTKHTGYMFNISDEFTTSSDFKEGAGYVYPAGTNVYYTADGKWDCLAGTMVTGVKGNAEDSYRKGNINITMDNLGYGNVENKSSATIRDEITKDNVTKALGYVPIYEVVSDTEPTSDFWLQEYK